MSIPNNDKQNYPFDRKQSLKRLDPQLKEPTNQNLTKVSKSVKPMNKKTLM